MEENNLAKYEVNEMVNKYNRLIEQRRKALKKYFNNRYKTDPEFKEKKKKYALERYYILKQQKLNSVNI